MNKLFRHPAVALSTLMFCAVFAGIVWRIEVNTKGWDGTYWASYYHLAGPAACLIFLAWINLSIKMSSRQRIMINVIGSCLLAIVLWFTETAFRQLYGLMYGPRFPFELVGLLAFLLFFPTALGFTLRIANYRVFWPLMIVSTGLLCTSPFIGIELIEIFDNDIRADEIHTIKSGWLLGIWFFAIGLLFIGIRDKKAPSKESVDVIDDF